MSAIPLSVQAPVAKLEDALEAWAERPAGEWSQRAQTAIDTAVHEAGNVIAAFNVWRDELYAELVRYTARRPR